MADKNMPPLIFFPIPRLYFQQDFALQSDIALDFSIIIKKNTLSRAKMIAWVILPFYILVL